MKTAELTGALLDYWVAKAEGQVPDKFTPPVADGMFLRYSSDWADGGPLIEKYQLSMMPVAQGWETLYVRGVSVFDKNIGPTLLVAICRAVVRSVYGDEVPE